MGHEKKAEVARRLMMIPRTLKLFIGRESINRLTKVGSEKALFQFFLWPISYSGVIWELYVIDLKTKFFVEKEPDTFSHGQGTHVSQCQNSADSFAKNTLSASKNFSTICLPKPKSFYLKKKNLGVRSPCLQPL